jgi:lysyl-tRNA synthetase class 1
MHWSFSLAEEAVKKYPHSREYVVASGISPSGSVHIGNYREFVTNYYVAKALKTMGKKVRMIFSWDEFDRFRKVPKNFTAMAKQASKSVNYADYIGRPYVEVPSPAGEGSSAKFFEREFEQALKILRMDEIPVSMIYQADEYRKGRYGAEIAYAIKKRKEIFDIIDSFKTKTPASDDEEGVGADARANYYPISIYCGCCGKDNTKILRFDEKTDEIEYECKCGHRHKTDVKTADNIKLVWKVDWPMRWKAENVCFEAAGIDHHSEGGSFDVAARIAREIWGIEPPCSVCYAWVGIRGLGTMHSSSGINITPHQLLQVYEPEILRYLYAKYPVGDAFDFGFDDTIIRHYTEFDRGVCKYLNAEECGPYDKVVYDLCLFDSTKRRGAAAKKRGGSGLQNVPAGAKKCDSADGGKVSFGTLATVAPLAGFNRDLTEKILQNAGVISEPDERTAESFDERFGRVKYWLENYMPDRIYKVLPDFNAEFYATLDAQQREVLANLKQFLAAGRTEKEIQEFLYAAINAAVPDAPKKEMQLKQQSYFKIFYQMLFGRDDGPRLYLFLSAADKGTYLKLLAPPE